MEHLIPNDFIEEVRRQADILEIISDHVVLKRTGKNYQGLCPFHSEKTPSFNVNPERQTFYCFGCHEGGNVFTFLMKRKNLSFLEALKEVAETKGLVVPEKELTAQERENEARRKRFHKIHGWASDFFNDILLNRSEGRAGLEYLKGRGIDPGTIQLFRLGYAPNKWDGLLKEMAVKGVEPEELVELGLVVKKERADESQNLYYYDRFRNRVMYTIFDVRNSPIGFGGRVLDDSLPKYLNSPDTGYFHKGRNLYGLNLASRGIREAGYAILLEGYMDAIALNKAGFKNAVASLGTAFTRDQAKLIKKYTKKVVIGYDSDNAGIQAVLRAGEILLEEGFRTEVLVLEEAKDPDEYLAKYKPELFGRKLENTISFIEFKFNRMLNQSSQKTIAEKAEIIRLLAPDILKTQSAVEREGYQRYLSVELGLSLEAVQDEINSQRKETKENKNKTKNNLQKQDISVKKRNTIEGTNLDYPLDTFVPLGIFRAEQTILRLVLEYPSFKNKTLENLGPDFWKIREHRFIFENFPRADINFPEDEIKYQQVQKRLAEIYALEIETSEAEALLMDCIALIQTVQNNETIEELQTKMIKLEKSGDMAGAMAVLQKIGERLQRGE